MPTLLQKVEGFYADKGLPVGPEVDELVRNSSALGLSDDEVLKNLQARHAARAAPDAPAGDAHLVAGAKVFLKRSNGKWTPSKITSVDSAGYVVEWQEADGSWLHKVVSFKNKGHLKPRGEGSRKDLKEAAAAEEKAEVAKKAEEKKAADADALAEAQRIAMEAADAQEAAAVAARKEAEAAKAKLREERRAAEAAAEEAKREAVEAAKRVEAEEAQRVAAAEAAAEAGAAEAQQVEDIKEAARVAMVKKGSWRQERPQGQEDPVAKAAEEAKAKAAAARQREAEEAERKAAEEKAAAEAERKAAAERKEAAERKAAEEKAAAEAELKAAEEKAAAERKAAEEKAAAEAELKAAEEKAAAERKAAEEKAAAETKALKEAAEDDDDSWDERPSAFARPRGRVHFNPAVSPVRAPQSPTRSTGSIVAPVSPVQFRKAVASPKLGPRSPARARPNTTDLLLVDGRGTSVLDEVAEFLDDEKVQFILTQMPLGSGTFKRNKWLFLTYVGEKVKMMTKAKHVQKSGAVSEIFGSTHASLTLTQRDQVNLEYVLESLKHVFVADDGTFSIAALREEITRNVEQAQEEQQEALEEAVRQTMAELPTVRPTAAGIGLGAEEVMAELRKPLGAFNWALFEANVNELEMVDAGSDSLIEMAEYVDEKKVQYALVRLAFGIGPFRRTKWMVLTFVGEEVPAVKRGRMLALRGDMEELLRPHQVTLECRGRDALEVQSVIERVRPYIVADEIEKAGGKSLGSRQMKVTMADFEQALAEEKVVTAEFFGEDPAASVASLAAFAPLEKDFEQGDTIRQLRDEANPLLWGVFSINPDVKC
eukprot:TRINITY_DN1530_c0_g2_i1.p1 TRINITY_DN1530_c0_g2~~TRINITY_DN1530_c0_g2_i1.p1  ORF type:complete len:825 (+),score=420.85 TRINITY_DN1530_c0_g2_i1:72-2546(+)